MHRRPNTLTALLLALLSASIGANPALDGETARLQTQHQELQQQRHDLPLTAMESEAKAVSPR
ncbi:MAG: hypothetical protein B0D96_00400 [Candidatus Sedimenticola endophacoides]|uniref:Uncharacterized protein n=1 Tax=Candidatus Sedimenticola endophacoides TaxID=2548426 RepID=A0A6N4E9X6_9GAMM|nr:MAG: hypothetical protein B0D94_00080 [Candidatus Sedimenticola endophacoides]OQX38324.1 MAG: hypothetical protein B0D96_00400 [Candidatus Sedimenticola endophacoides]OQX43048.1 MAG: hypothetical protein B0D89_00080 [Candidatus Sedimenticola endophacoides]PUE01188.1 MAG: hypothetical protein C3L26_03920 [Candidatus Sedimenticola endophacoides]PUE04540.1 MAG: hypothetical protein C3L25_03910 [Candidatus Sedimenticola endophacoides]